MLMVLMNCYISSYSLYNKDQSNLTTNNRSILELWCKFKVCHATLCLLILIVMRTPIYRDTVPLALSHNVSSAEPQVNLRVRMIVERNIGLPLQFDL